MRLVIIGNGMAATRLIASLTGRAADRFTITVIGDEPEHAYNRIQLSPVLGGEKTAAGICLQNDDWYQERGVTVLRGEKALAVNVDTREVQTTARTLGWDALVFATGSTPFVPPIPGCNATHVFTFRTLEDIRAIRAIAGPAVVLGGGVLGVETAAALARSGDNVTLVHRGPWLMEQQLDEKAGVLLEEALAARGVRCELASGIAAIDGNSVTLLNGRSVTAARVVLATGVQPNVVLAQASGIRCARGIVVDHQMQTSVPDVYAIGECCEIDGQTFGLVAPLSGAGGYPRHTAGRRRHRAVCPDRQRRAPQGDRRGAVQPRSRGRAGGRCGLERMGSADPSLSSFTDPSGGAGWRAADGGLPQRGDIYRFTGNGCARARGLAVRSFHYATAGCRTERYDKTYSGGGWARYGRPSFPRRLR